MLGRWTVLFGQVKAADIIVVAGPIWLGDSSSVTKQVIERLSAMSGVTNEAGPYVCYGKVGGALATGNEDGVEHCAMNILYSLQHNGGGSQPGAICPRRGSPGSTSVWTPIRSTGSRRQSPAQGWLSGLRRAGVDRTVLCVPACRTGARTGLA